MQLQLASRIQRLRGPWRGVARLASSAWLWGLIVAAASWNVVVQAPSPGLDPSWEAALYLAAEHGLHSGTQVVFTYGPLGFLAVPGLWFIGLGVASFAYQGVLTVAVSITLVWALSRSLNVVVAAIIAALILAAATGIELEIVLVVLWCLAALTPSPSPVAERLVVYGGSVIGAISLLVLLRTGPVVLAVCLITLLAGERRGRRVATFAACAVIAFAIGWFASGQGVGNLVPYGRHGLQIVLGYSQAMSIGSISQATLVSVIAVAVLAPVLAGLCAASGRRRWAATAVVAVAAVALYKEAIIRQDLTHLHIFFSSILVIAAGTLGRRSIPLAIGALTVIAAVVLTIPSLPTSIDLISHARLADSEIREMAAPSLDRGLGEFGIAEVDRVDPETIALLRDHTVDVDPWEAAVAWMYHLRWKPVPVFQNYSAYTSNLDRLNAATLQAADGPQRILRENVVRDPTVGAPDIDSRLPAWDPPLQALTMLCNYDAVRTTERWQVLAKVADRCGQSRLLATIHANRSRPIVLPRAPAHAITFVKIAGAETLRDRLRGLVYRGDMQYLIVNGMRSYRLVAGTADDGLLTDVPTGSDFAAPFALSPQARTLELPGSGAGLVVRVYAMPFG
jgi:hypothetical protein